MRKKVKIVIVILAALAVFFGGCSNEIREIAGDELYEWAMNELPDLDIPLNQEEIESYLESYLEGEGLPGDTVNGTTPVPGKGLEVHFIDVGQGDCILIKDGDEEMLIDAGDNDKGTLVQNYLEKQGVGVLETFVMTHPDADHIGGADVIISKFEIDSIYMPDYAKDTRTYEDVLNALEYKYLEAMHPEPGDTWEVGEALVTVIGPVSRHEDANNNSIVLMVDYGNTSFLFMGDCEEEEEQEILASDQSLGSNVIKIGHHGSRSSSTEVFLEAVSPKYEVICCGEDNDYGHPHAATLNTLRSMGVEVFRTDEQGSIIAYSDGETVSWNCAPSDSWKAGN